jgi:hypothetical protein
MGRAAAVIIGKAIDENHHSMINIGMFFLCGFMSSIVVEVMQFRIIRNCITPEFYKENGYWKGVYGN